MCTYNGGRFLAEQLQSIAAQERPPDELVICDDGSSDETREIVKDFARRCAFATQVVVNESKLGSTKNFEKAISLCRSNIVALADQDDVWYPHKLASIRKTFLESRETVATFSNADLMDEKSRLLGLRLWSAFSFDAGQQYKFANHRALEVLVKHPVVTGATMAFRRELFDLVTPIPSNHIHDRWISFLLAARGKFEAIRAPLMQYRRHEQQQEGLPPQVRAELITQAKTRGSSFHLKEMRLFEEIHARLREREADFPYAPLALIEIERKVSHLALRAHLPSQRLARIPLILKESFNLGYWRYSAGWNSVARDLMIV
jgi:glycosyltransferase involved in cell wall biosynthesis